jgi:hypothetical protein
VLLQTKSYQAAQFSAVSKHIDGLELPMAWGPKRLKDADIERRGHVTCISGEDELVGIRTRGLHT